MDPELDPINDAAGEREPLDRDPDQDPLSELSEQELIERLLELRGAEVPPSPEPEWREPPARPDTRARIENVPLVCPQGHHNSVLFVSMVECRIEITGATLKKGVWTGDHGHQEYGPISEGVYRCAECGWEDPNIAPFHPDPDGHLERGVVPPELDERVKVEGGNVLGPGAAGPSPEAHNPNSMKQTYAARAEADKAKIAAAKARAEAEAAARDA